MANIIDIIVNGKDNASRVLERVGQTAERAFQRAERASTRLTTKMKEIGSRGRELGENMVDMSENLMQGITLPLALIGGVAVKSAGDIDRMFSVLKAQTGNSEAAMKRLTPIVQQVFRDGLGKDLNEVATIAGYAQRQLWKLNDAQLTGVINNVAALSTILGVDATGAIDQVRELMMKFGITSDQAMDLIAAGVQTADLNSSNLAKTLQQVKGRAEEITGIAQDDTWVRFQSVWRQIQEALKPVGDELIKLAMDYLPKVISSIESFSKWFTSLSDSGKLATVAIAAFVAVLPVILMSLGALIMLGSSLIEFFGTIGGALAAVTAPTWAWIAGIAALIAILIIAWNQSEAFRNVVLRGWNAIVTGFQAVVAYLTPAVMAVVNFVLQQWTKIQQWWSTNGAVILQSVQNVFNFMLPIIKVFMSSAVSILSAGWALIVSIFTTTWSILKILISSGVSIILNLISLFANILTGRWSAAWNNVKSILSTVWSAIKSILSTGVHGAVSILSGAVGLIKSVWSGVTNALTAPVRAAFGVIMGLVGQIKSALTGATGAARSASGAASSAVSRLSNAGGGRGVKWHATGGLFNGPSIIGVGEAGKEAVIPLSGPNMRPFAQAIAREMGGGSPKNQQPIINIYEAQRTTDKEVLNAMRKAAFLYG